MTCRDDQLPLFIVFSFAKVRGGATFNDFFNCDTLCDSSISSTIKCPVIINDNYENSIASSASTNYINNTSTTFLAYIWGRITRECRKV